MLTINVIGRIEIKKTNITQPVGKLEVEVKAIGWVIFIGTPS